MCVRAPDQEEVGGEREGGAVLTREVGVVQRCQLTPAIGRYMYTARECCVCVCMYILGKRPWVRPAFLRWSGNETTNLPKLLILLPQERLFILVVALRCSSTPGLGADVAIFARQLSSRLGEDGGGRLEERRRL